MGDWKDDLKKLKPNLPSGGKNDAGKSKREANKTKSVQNEVAWKKDAKPLKKGSGKVSHKKSKSKKSPSKFVRKRFKDSLPSGTAILSAYGSSKPLPKQPLSSKTKPIPPLPGFDDLPQVTLTRTSEFKEPDSWVQAGTGLQSPGGGSGRVLRVRMGIDFGTCYTKVALRAADKVFFINWDGLRNSNQHYFLPGELSRRADGSAWLGRPSDAIKTFGGLKVPFLSPAYAGDQDSVASVAFIAWVMRYTRAWLYRHHGPLVDNRQLAWEVNMGSPTDPWCSTTLNDSYRDLCLCAWHLSQAIGNISLDMAGEVLNDVDIAPEEVGLESLQIVPEFAAQVSGYVQSPQRREGLHLFVDVGAGTMDIVCFNIYRRPKSDDDRLPIFAGAVEILGTHVYMSERLSTLPSAEKNWTDLEGLPTQEQLISEFGVDSEVLLHADENFSDWVKQTISKILCYTKARRYPNAPEWKEGMRVFLAGGGSSCEVYKNGIRRSFSDIRTQPLFTTFPMLEGAARRVGEKDFHRVSVAFGLTFDAESIGKTIRPRDIEDIPQTTHYREMPDRDELYPK